MNSAPLGPTKMFPLAWDQHERARTLLANDGVMPKLPLSKDAAWKDFERIQLNIERNVRIFRGVIKPKEVSNAIVQ